MADKVIVPPGTRVTIEIDEETARGGISGTSGLPGADDGGRSGGLLEGRREDDLLFRRQIPGTITFYDLGARLRSTNAPDLTGEAVYPIDPATSAAPHEGYTNEYLELDVNLLGTPYMYLDGTIGGGLFYRYFGRKLSPEEVGGLNSRLLGIGAEVDPLGFTPANVTGRRVPNSMPLPFTCPHFFDLFIGETEFLVGSDNTEYNPEVPDFGDWKQRKGLEADAAERWNGFNIASGIPHKAGELKIKNRPRGALKIKPNNSFPYARGIVYQEFDTGDAEKFKVTRLPSYDAEAVNFSVPGGALRVYLRPRNCRVQFSLGLQIMHSGVPQIFQTDFYLNSGASILWTNRYWLEFLGRFPVYPKFYYGFDFGLDPEERELITKWARRTPPLLPARDEYLGTAIARVPEGQAGDTFQGAPYGKASFRWYVNEYLPDMPGTGIFAPNHHVSFDPSGELVAVLVAGEAPTERRYYVWRTGARIPPDFAPGVTQIENITSPELGAIL